MSVIGLILAASAIAGALHWRYRKWWLSLCVPFLGYAAFVLLFEFALADGSGGASFGLLFAAIYGIPSVFFGALLGALVARSLRVARDEERAL
jgi:hypothetical protein